MAVPNTGRAGDVDLFIKGVAFELDALLGAGYVLATYNGTLTPDTSGYVDVPFPLSQVVGAIIMPTSALPKTNGIPAYADPVPPATIGRYIGYTGFQCYLLIVNVTAGVVRCALRTSTWQDVTGSASTVVGYGSRIVGTSPAVPLTGLAWGRA